MGVVALYVMGVVALPGSTFRGTRVLRRTRPGAQPIHAVVIGAAPALTTNSRSPSPVGRGLAYEVVAPMPPSPS
jgi:hypothetical protein